jgi:signal recognition particle subunit SRP54
LNGAGKTTFTGKLANFLKTQKNKKPLLVADDIYRPAAIDPIAGFRRADRCTGLC